MDAAVPFALVAAVQLLSLAAALGLAAAGGAAAYRRRSRGLLVGGALLLATAHGLTGALLGDTGGGTAFALVRAAGYVLVGLGAAGLALAPLSALAAAPLAGVVVPLGATPPAATVAAAGAAVATLLSRRLHRPGATLLTGALALSVVTEVLAGPARTSPAAAVTLLALRGVAALAVLAFVVRLIENSLLAKVVAAILAGVLGLALGTAFIVGSVATGTLNRDSENRLSDVARGQIEILANDKQSSLALARVLAKCEPAQFAICTAQLGATGSPIVGLVCGLKDPKCLPNGAAIPNLRDDPVAIRSLKSSGAVTEVLASRDDSKAVTLDVLLGRTPSLIALGVAPVYEQANAGPRRPDAAAVYAVRIDANRIKSIRRTTGFAATLYLSGHREASTLPDPRAAVLDRELRRLRVEETLRDDPQRAGVSVTAEGSRPGVRYEAIRAEDDSLVGVLALSAESDVILATERRVLSSLFVGTIAIALLVGLLAVALGRRIVRPVTELTVAASRVRRGDLDVRTDVRSGDELGVLSRTFDAMTASLASSNESLRRAATDEAALRGRLETIVDSIADGLVTTDDRDRVAGINGAGLDLLAAAEETLLGRPVAEVLAGVATSGEPLLAGPLGADRLERTGRLTRPDGGTVPVTLAATPLHGERGHVIVVRDMTREHEVERMKTEFLSNVSHELRTPLTPIRGYAEILQRRPDLPAEKTTMYAGSILESSVRMSRVVDLLVDVASLEAGRVVPDRRPVPVGAFVDERLAAWRRREPSREFRRRVAARLPDVVIDPAWVGKAFDELVDNAVKYSAGPVTISASLSDTLGRVRLTVRDSGQGIPDDRRASLFTPFEQVDGSATRTVGGLGLGLSFVRRVADDFGLDVVVESTLGKGSAFSLEVPADAATRPARPAPRRRAPAARSPKGRTR
jgi:PAS domain S-box-containing protein